MRHQTKSASFSHDDSACRRLRGFLDRVLLDVGRTRSGAGPTDGRAAILDSLHLLEPLWDSAVVHRESSVLMRMSRDAAVARLAYPAARDPRD
ncbi:MAG: hypothetical protein R3B96_24735 [Pirellulaceae bacterium]